MCEPVTLTMLYLGATAAGAAVQMYGIDTQAKQAESNAKFQAAQSEADAKAAEGAARVEAERIRRAAKAQRAQAVAAAAASGVDVASPTAVKIDEEIHRNAETDAYLTILNGQDTGARLRQQAVASRNAGAAARTAGNIQMGSTLLSTAATMTNYGQGWKKDKEA